MIAQALMCVFKEWTYVFIAAVVALLVFVLATWLANLGLVWQITVSPSVPLFDKAKILAGLVGSIRTNFTVLSALYTIAIAVLFGLNTAMVTYYMKMQKGLRMNRGQASAAAGLGGLASGFIGMGCAACGTFVLAPVLSIVGAAGFIALLPFDGQEFGLLGVGMLGFSIVLVAKKIGEPLVCPLVPQENRKI
ncbi:MAG TPA: hypothetical protein VGA17_01555 [Nitrospiraceae bacterium]